MARVDHARAAFTVGCAIYTRKSSDEGLEQEFNSLSTKAVKWVCTISRYPSPAAPSG